MAGNDSETMDTCVQLLGQLETLKSEHPELEEVLQKFQITQAEYDQTMLSILAAEIEPRSTYTINRRSINCT